MADVEIADGDYVLKDGCAWFTVKGHFSVRIHETDEGIVVDVWVKGHEANDHALLASTYAFDDEATNFLSDNPQE